MQTREAAYDKMELEIGGETCLMAASVAPHNTAVMMIRPVEEMLGMALGKPRIAYLESKLKIFNKYNCLDLIFITLIFNALFDHIYLIIKFDIRV